ncbi:MAG TPA: carboxylesterase family protein, partial [Acidobacteriaceae bacterium]|nr:carboxylesterase family protein [Acidobacteriaceae bacterium]
MLSRVAGITACLIGLVLIGVRAEASARGKQARVEQGVLAGTRFGSGGAEFLGIPYAAAPVGRLRWVAPQEPAKWAGVRDASSYGAACPQLPSAWLPEMLGRKEMQTSEDCLYLNVWTPR